MYLKDKIRQITFENFESQYINNAELFRIETFVDDLAFLNKHFSAYRREFDKMRNYFIFVNIYCFKKKVHRFLPSVSDTTLKHRREDHPFAHSADGKVTQRELLPTSPNLHHPHHFLL